MSDTTTELLRRHARQLERDLEAIRDLIAYNPPDHPSYIVARIGERVRRALDDARARHEAVGL